MTMSKKTVDMRTRTPEDYLKEPYARVLIPEAEGGYSAEILEFPGCYSYGDTVAETMQNLEDAAFNWIGAAIVQGQDIPRPFSSYEASGRVALRLPRSLHHKAVQMAERERVSLNTFLVGAIEARVGVGNFYDRMIKNLENRLVNKTAANVMAQFIPLLKEWDDTSFSAFEKRASTPPFVANVPITIISNIGEGNK